VLKVKLGCCISRTLKFLTVDRPRGHGAKTVTLYPVNKDWVTRMRTRPIRTWTRTSQSWTCTWNSSWRSLSGYGLTSLLLCAKHVAARVQATAQDLCLPAATTDNATLASQSHLLILLRCSSSRSTLCHLNHIRLL